MDSGAADHAMPLAWLTWIVVTAPMGSIRGLQYVSASGNRLPDREEKTVRFFTKDGTWASLLFQVAGINKPLARVSRLIDEGWKVVFDIESSYLLHKASKINIMMDRTRGVCTVEAYVEPEGKAPDERASHDPTRRPYRSWCRACVLGRGRNRYHHRIDGRDDIVQRIALD